MNGRDLLIKKREGGELTEAEVRWLISGYSAGRLPDYQMSAFLMATFFKSMSAPETVSLTRAMLDSGVRLDWKEFREPIADKHSTGGVGDKVSLILAPLAAACGMRVPMLSGRGLGHTGGTLDKLEAMHGFRTSLTPDEFRAALARVGCAMAGQSAELAPADKAIYALRDVTGTVECVPLIVASILSKKAAAGIRHLVFDLKCGDGAFMKAEAQALTLASGLVGVASGLGIQSVALVTNMDEPLGLAVGNALEVTESVECLRGEGPADVRELTLRLTAAMARLSGLAADYSLAYELVRSRLDDGSALRVFLEMIAAQGGKFGKDGLPVLDRAKHVTPLTATRDGFITRIAAYRLAMASVRMGAGRIAITDTVDPAVGVVLNRKVGDPVKAGELLGWVHTNKPDPQLVSEVAASFEVGPQRVSPRPLVSHVVTKDGAKLWQDWTS